MADTYKLDGNEVEDLGNGRKRIQIGWREATAADYGTHFADKDPLSNYLSSNKPYTNVPQSTEAKKIISMAMDFYRTQHLYRAYVNLLMDFSITKITNRSKDKKLVAAFDKWVEIAKIEQTCKSLLLDYFTVSNAYTYENSVALTPSNDIQKALKDAKVATGAAKKAWTNKNIPVSYTVLNPELVSVEGALLGNNIIMTLAVPDNLKDIIKKAKTDKNYKFLLENLDPELVSQISTNDAIVLDRNRVGTLYDRKRPYERYAIPPVYTAFPAFLRLNMLRNMDVSTITGFINQLITVTIGSDKFPATDKQLKKIAELFKNPSKSMTLFWNHTLNVEFHKPDITVLNDTKYQPVLEEIRSALRLPQFLIDGTGGSSYATAVIASKPIVKRIYQALDDLKQQWLIPQYKKVAAALGFEDIPEIDFGENALEDEATKIKILTALRTHNLVSAKTAMEKYAGNNFEHEVSNIREELPLVAEGILTSGSPYNASPGRPPLEGPADYPEKRESPPPKGGTSTASVVKRSKKRNIFNEETIDVRGNAHLTESQRILFNKISSEAEEVNPDDD